MSGRPARRHAIQYRHTIQYAASVASLLAIWWIVSTLLSEEVLPGPLSTFSAMAEEYRRGVLLDHVLATMERVLASFGLAMALGVLIGAAMGGSPLFDRLFNVWLITGLAFPRLVLIVAAYLLIGLNDRAAILAITLAVVPTVVAQVREGTKAIDRRLVEMAQAFRRSPLAVGWRVILPQLLPYIVGTARGALALSWKMVVFAELMGRTNGVGYQISFYFQMFNMQGILVYALAMVLVMAAIDLLVMRSIERAVFRWRGPLSLSGKGVEG